MSVKIKSLLIIVIAVFAVILVASQGGPTALAQTIIGPWIVTARSSISTGGFSGFYIRDIDLEGVVPELESDDSYLATYSAIASSNLMVPDRESQKDFMVTNYTDRALYPPDVSGFNNWYDYLYDLVSGNFELDEQTSSSINGDFSDSLSVEAGSPFYTHYSGNLTIASDSECDIRGVFFIEGTLTIEPSLTRYKDNGCIFISRGDITITEGSRVNSSSKSISESADYDVVEAFLITDGKYTSENDQFGTASVPDGLLIKGGIHAEEIEIGRSLNFSHDDRQPAEVYVYDPFFENTFKGIFAMRTFSLRSQD